MPFVTTLMNLKDMLSRISGGKEDKYCSISLTCGVLEVTEAESRVEVPRA